VSSGGNRSSAIAHWRRKFGDALDGLIYGILTESSLRFHFCFAALVVVVAGVLSIEALSWAILIVCIAIVITAEYFNSAIEQLVRSIDPGRTPEIAKVLHLAAAAVLISSFLAAIVGLIILAPAALRVLGR
jgi:diacylglycerol kinase